MKKISILLITVLLSLMIFTGCSQKPIQNNSPLTNNEDELRIRDEKILELENKINDLESNNDLFYSSDLISRAIGVMELISVKDMEELSKHVHPIAGVRFTPYFYVNTQSDKVFTASEVAGLMQDNQILTWGNYDGSGEPIDLKFSDYYEKFIYDKDFVNPEIIGNNVALGKGNVEDNIVEAYPNGQFVEFHFSQFDPQFQGIDWESLRLVFEEHNDIWYLVGVIHGQWTI